MPEFLTTVWAFLLRASIFISILCLFIGILEIHLLGIQTEPLKRGFKLSSQPLKPEQKLFLTNLATNQEEDVKIFGIKITEGFILVKDSQRLIKSTTSGHRTVWPYVGYVDLSSPEPHLEYRSSLFMHLVTLPFILSGVGILFIALFIFLNHIFETKKLQNYLQKQMDSREQVHQ